MGSPLGQPIVCHIKDSNCLEKYKQSIGCFFKIQHLVKNFLYIFWADLEGPGVASKATNFLSYQILKLSWKSQLVASSKFNISWKIFCIFSEQTWRALGSPLRQPIFCHIKYSNCLEKVNWLLLQNSTFRENFSVIFSEQTWRAHGVASRATNCLSYQRLKLSWKI